MVRLRNIVWLWLLLSVAPSSALAEKPIVLLVHGTENANLFRSLDSVDVSTDTNNLLLDEFKGYSYELQPASMSRIDKLLRTQDNVCAINRVKNAAREQRSDFSRPINLYMGLKLYYLTGQKNLPESVFNSAGELMSLKALFEVMRHQSLGKYQGRSYGEILDRQLARVKAHNLFIRGGNTSLINMMQMLEKKRFDFWIEYPVQIKKAKSLLGYSLNLTSITIADSTRYIVGYVECGRSAITERFIRDINATLGRLYQNPEFKHAHTRYLDEADIDIFERYYEQVFK